jgi:hypothetical protein
VFLLLLLSAANTAIVAMIGLYMTARDGEMPPQFKRFIDMASRCIRCS